MSTQFGIVHEPLLITPIKGKGWRNVRVGKYPALLEPDSLPPLLNQETEAMITRARYHSYPAGHPHAGKINFDDFWILGVRVVDPTLHVLVAINGFVQQERTGRILARGRQTDGTRPLTKDDVYPPKRFYETRQTWKDRCKDSLWLTPGVTGVAIADLEKDQVPTNVWVERRMLLRSLASGVRIEGLTRFQDGRWFPLLRQ